MKYLYSLVAVLWGVYRFTLLGLLFTLDKMNFWQIAAYICGVIVYGITAPEITTFMERKLIEED